MCKQRRVCRIVCYTIIPIRPINALCGVQFILGKHVYHNFIAGLFKRGRFINNALECGSPFGSGDNNITAARHYAVTVSACINKHALHIERLRNFFEHICRGKLAGADDRPSLVTCARMPWKSLQTNNIY